MTLTLDNLRNILTKFVDNENYMNHYEFANICDEYMFEVISNKQEIDSYLYNVIIDISAQWELYLRSICNSKELNKIDLSTIKMPKQFFIDWLNNIQIEGR